MVFTGMGQRALEVQVQGDASDLTSTLTDARQGLGKFRTAVLAVGGALTALGVGSLAKATQAAAAFEEQMVEVEKVTDPSTAREMSEAVREMASEMPVAQKELAGIVAQAGRLGIEGVDNLRTFTRVTAEMAVATNLGAEEAAEAFARISTLMELPVSEARNLGAAINELSNNMAASSSEIVDAATRSSGVLTQLGLESQSILALNAAMNEVSASSRLAGTQLRRFAQSLTDPKKVEDLAGALGMSVTQFRRMRDTEPVKLISQLAGAFDEGGATARELNSVLGSTSRQTLSKLAQNWASVEEGTNLTNEQFDEATSLTKEFEAAADTFNSRLQVTINRLRNAGIETGGVLLPVLTDLLGVVNDGIVAFNELNRATDGLAGSLAGVGATAAGVGMVLSGLGIAAGGPVALAIAGIGALAIAWSRNLFGMRDTTSRVMADISETMGRALEALTGETQQEVGKQMGIWERGEIRMAGIFDRIGTSFAQFVDSVVTGVDIVGGTIHALGRMLGALAKGNFERVGQILEGRIATNEFEVEKFMKRRKKRARNLSLRMGDRRGAIGTSDRSLLPGNRAGKDQGQTIADELQKNREEAKERREELMAMLEKQRAEQQGIRDNTAEQSRMLRDSALMSSSRCDLSQFLLEPLERVPRQRGNGARSEDTLEDRVAKSAAEETHKGTDPATIVQDTVRELLSGGESKTVLEVDGKKLAEELDKQSGMHGVGGGPLG